MLALGTARGALSGPRGVWDQQEGGTDPAQPLTLALCGLSPGAWGLGAQVRVEACVEDSKARCDPFSAFFIGSHSRTSGSAKLTLPATSRVMLEPCVFRFAGCPPSLALDGCGVTVWTLPVLARVALGDVHSFSIPSL